MASVNRPDVTVLEDGRIRVAVNRNTSLGPFADSLYFTAAEFSALEDAAVDARAQARADAWVAFVNTQSSVESPPVEDQPA